MEDFEAQTASDSRGVLVGYATIARDAEDGPPDHRAPRRALAGHRLRPTEHPEGLLFGVRPRQDSDERSYVQFRNARQRTPPASALAHIYPTSRDVVLTTMPPKFGNGARDFYRVRPCGILSVDFEERPFHALG